MRNIKLFIVIVLIAVLALATWGIWSFVKHENRQQQRLDIMDEFISVMFRDEVAQYLQAKRGLPAAGARPEPVLPQETASPKQ